MAETDISAVEAVAPGVHLAATDVQEVVSAYIKFNTGPEAEAAGRRFYYGEEAHIKRSRIIEWHKMKETMGKEEFMRIGYCPDCAVEANISFRKDIPTKCSRHSAPVPE